MFQQIKDAIVERLKTVTQAKLAIQCGVAPATLDNIKNNRTDKVSNEMLRKLAVFFSIEDTVGDFEWSFYETPQTQIVQQTVRGATEMRRMVGIVGDTGFGKTTALRDYVNENANCGYVLCDALMSQFDLVVAIAKSLGLQSDGKIRDIVIRVSKHAAEKNTTIILDDCSKLKDDCFGLIQIIYDSTQGHASIILTGLQKLQTRIRIKAEKDKYNFREFQRRVAYWRELPHLKPATVKSIASDYGFEKEVVDFLIQKCKDYGSLRNAIENLWAWKRKHGETATRDVASDLID